MRLVSPGTGGRTCSSSVTGIHKIKRMKQSYLFQKIHQNMYKLAALLHLAFVRRSLATMRIRIAGTFCPAGISSPYR